MVTRPTRPTRPFRHATALAAVLLVMLVAAPVHGASSGTSPFTGAILSLKPDSGTPGNVVKTVQDELHFPLANLLYFFCWPPSGGETDANAKGTLDIGVDGALTGSCTASKTTTVAGLQKNTITRTSSITGTYAVQQQLVGFRMEGHQSWTITRIGECNFGCDPYTFSSTVAIEATDVRVDGDSAAGTARYTYQCAVTAGTGDCASTITQADGTVDFTLSFQPGLGNGGPTAGTGGASGAGADADPDAWPLPMFIILVILLALVLLGVARLRRHGGYRASGAIAEAERRVAETLTDQPKAPSSTAPPSKLLPDDDGPPLRADIQMHQDVILGAELLNPEEPPKNPLEGIEPPKKDAGAP